MENSQKCRRLHNKEVLRDSVHFLPVRKQSQPTFLTHLLFRLGDASKHRDPTFVLELPCIWELQLWRYSVACTAGGVRRSDAVSILVELSIRLQHIGLLRRVAGLSSNPLSRA